MNDPRIVGSKPANLHKLETPLLISDSDIRVEFPEDEAIPHGAFTQQIRQGSLEWTYIPMLISDSDIRVEFPEDAAIPYSAFTRCLRESGLEWEYTSLVQDLERGELSPYQVTGALQRLQQIVRGPKFISPALKEDFMKGGGGNF